MRLGMRSTGFRLSETKSVSAAQFDSLKTFTEKEMQDVSILVVCHHLLVMKSTSPGSSTNFVASALANRGNFCRSGFSISAINVTFVFSGDGYKYCSWSGEYRMNFFRP